TRYALVTEEEMEVLRGIRDDQPEGSVRTRPGEEEKDDELSLFGVSYRVGEGRGHVHEMNDADLEEILQAIRHAKRNSDFVVATIHAHDPGNWSDEPPNFLVDLAHRAIDAGADEFVGHGPHQLRGIEIYRGKPIFYSLANFVFQVELQEPVARDLYEGFEIDPDTMPDSEFNRRWLEIGFDDEIWYESVLAESRFAGGQVREIRLHPVELGYGLRGGNRGVPRTAPPEQAREILERLRGLSRPFGTEISIEDGVGVIRPAVVATGASR
ncbi:MAG: CapA family protein, partial [Gemmatimonadetes bacterium]|nr:CapA family protein [Gemmatimonadota bacterium]NIR78157.1 CapA family protein [Gemmatimonadota bacterium]NIT86724.1 CapA family protein [Gemmatimonadota bacterium]NIU30582.1 CapA family protein [Gemmatimonadota bacterium]NIU35407.1 CapA family protein [Gemmatimonadota bacterium]